MEISLNRKSKTSKQKKNSGVAKYKNQNEKFTRRNQRQI